MTLELTQKAKREAEQQAARESAAITARYAKGILKSWADIETSLVITVPADYHTRPFSYITVSDFARFWRQSWQARIEAALATASDNKVKVVTGNIRQKDCSVYGSVTLFPEQEALFRRMYDDLFIQRVTGAALQDGETGSGKTFVAAAMIAEDIKRGALDDPIRKYIPFQYIVFTPKNVVEQYKRVLDSFGLARYVATQKILVTSYSQLSTTMGTMLISEREDLITEQVELVWNPVIQPRAIFFDESQKLNNWTTYQTRCARAACDGTPDTVHVMFSATPFEKVNDSRTLVEAINRPILGLTINDERSFNNFASLIDNTPSKPNQDAMRRLREVLGPYIYSLPRAKWPHKAINQVELVDFANDHDRMIYKQAHDKYIEVCKKVGKNTEFGQFGAFVALGNFKKTAEPLRAPHLAEIALRNYREGKIATVIGAAHKETIIRCVFSLAEQGVPREHMSIIWGGGKNLNPADLMTQEEIDVILRGIGSVRPDRRTFQRLKRTLEYIEEQHSMDETPQQQAYRHERMAALKLRGTQSADQRQKEIDAFQSGRSRICLFTIASGGVGLSLDKDKPYLLPREGHFTPVWNGKEFKQALGRLVRRSSLADAHQYVSYMRGTVEEYHVAPLLDNKLKCIAEMTNRQFEVFDLLARTDRPDSTPQLMSSDEASAVAEDSGHIIPVDDSGDEDDADSEELF